jgi:hypothetical protein
MCRIILNGNIADLLERIDPPNDLFEDVSDYNNLSVLASVFPSRLYRLSPRFLGSGVQFGEDVELVRAVKVYVLFVIVG